MRKYIKDKVDIIFYAGGNLKHKIIVYGAPWCPWCHRAKDFLNESKIEFEDRDVDKRPEYAQEVINKSGQMGIPVIDIDGNIIIGFNKDAIKKALGL
ncbi:MAG: glutaredoxin family protein [Candidatus Aenigmarchaeota archaeon]|nr:glutaredoxin family protein [Candidatus Aenigmarchaeota archaeon]